MALTIADLYQQILGRAPESQQVIDMYNTAYGPTIDANEVAQFVANAQPELANSRYQPTIPQAPAPVNIPQINPVNALQDFVNTTKDPQQVANKIQELGGLTPDLTNVLVQKFGSNPTSVQTAYNELTPPGSLKRNEDFLTRPNPRGYVIGDAAGFNLGPVIALAAIYLAHSVVRSNTIAMVIAIYGWRIL